MPLFNFGVKKVVKELTEKYEAEYKRITGCTPQEMKYPLIPDDDEYAAVKKLRADILKEAEARNVGNWFNWLR